MKLSKKLLLACIFLMAANLFAQTTKKWYICAGSFKGEPNANQRVQVLKNNNIDAFITRFEKADNDIYLRILINEPFDTLDTAHIRLAELNSNTVFASLGITGLWCCQAEVPEEPKELEEGRYILIKDSDTGHPVPDADVNIDKKWDVKTSNEGKAPLPNQIPDGEHEITVTKGDEYVATESKITIQENKITSVPQVSLPKAVDYDRIKIILEWGEYPYDLDSHVIQGNHHVYFNNMYEANLDLDLDDTTSYGPETTTIREPKTTETYRYYVFNYSDNTDNPLSKRLSNSMATVKVYYGNEFKKSFSIKPDQPGILWHVFDVYNGEILEINRVEPKSLKGYDIEGDFEIRHANISLDDDDYDDDYYDESEEDDDEYESDDDDSEE